MSEKPRRKAVIVGINEYLDKDEQGRDRFQKLEGAQNDALDFKERLEDRENPELNYEICSLIGSEATCVNIRKALSYAFWKTRETCDIALFYFSGHGLEDEWYNEGYIAPYDMLFDDPFVNGIKMSELRMVISKSMHNCTITILDCCYSGLATKEKGKIDVKAKFLEHFTEPAVEEVKGARIIFASSGEDQKSREITLMHEIAVEHKNEKEAHPHGAFTYSLIEGIDNGKTTLRELESSVSEKLEYLKRNIPNLNQQFTLSTSGPCNLEKIVIASSHEEKNKKIIENYIKAAESFIESGKTRETINSVFYIDNALKKYPKSEKALSLKGKTILSIELYRDKVLDWFINNPVPNSEYIFKNYNMLKDLARDITYEGIIRLSNNKPELSLLISLCSVSIGETDENDLEEIIKRYNSPKSQPTTKKKPNIKE